MKSSAQAVTAGAPVPQPAEEARPVVSPAGEVRPLHAVERVTDISDGPMGERLAVRKAELAAHPHRARLAIDHQRIHRVFFHITAAATVEHEVGGEECQCGVGIC